MDFDIRGGSRNFQKGRGRGRGAIINIKNYQFQPKERGRGRAPPPPIHTLIPRLDIISPQSS